MAARTIQGVNLNKPGNSLALWLSLNHPDLFLTAWNKSRAMKLAQAAKLRGLRGLRGLGQDEPSAQDLRMNSDPNLDSISVDTDSIVPNSFVSDATDSGVSALSTVASSPTSAGTTVGSVLASTGVGVQAAIAGVGAFLASATGLNAVSSIARNYYANQAASSTVQTQQQVLQTQLHRVATGYPAAPITYTTNSAGQVVPVYATQTPQGAVYQPLSTQGIASLSPSNASVFLSQYGIWIGVAVLVLLVGGTALSHR